MKLTILYLWLSTLFLLPSLGADADKPRAAEIAILKQQLQWLERASLQEVISALSRTCPGDDALTTAIPLYQDAISEERKLVVGGVGENHPRLKSVRAQKRLSADMIAARIDAARNQMTARLAALSRNQSQDK